MALEIKQQLRLTQQLKMTPQLQQAIKLLQLSRMELVDLVRQEMEENPVLEEGAEQEKERSDGEGGDREERTDRHGARRGRCRAADDSGAG
jgi:RNA polymerase sigma-54 factor